MKLDDFFIEPEEIPTMPHVIVKALNIISDDRSGLNELARIIACDQSLSTKVLRLVNSVHFSLPNKINSINKAVYLLGMNQAKNIIITISMQSAIFSDNEQELWAHSIRCAVACEILAKEFKIISPEDAFVLGFLHDIGKVIISRKDGFLHKRIFDLMKRGISSIDAEEMYLKTNHSVIGAYIVNQWNFSDIIIDAIKYHHNPLKSAHIKPTAIVYYANILAEETYKEPIFDPQVSRASGIYISDYFRIRNMIEVETEKLKSILTNVSVGV